MARRDSGLSGFSLLELMVAVVVATLVILGIAVMTQTSATTHGFTEERDIAREAARSKMEEILATDFAAIEATYFPGGQPSYFPAGSGAHTLRSSVAGQLPGRVTIDTATAPASPGANGLKIVIVEVRWTGRTGDQRLELVSYVANRNRI